MVEKAICVVGPPKGVDTPDFDRSLTNAILNLLHAYESEFEAFLRERDGFFSYLRSHHVDNEDPYDTLFCLEVTEMNGQTYMVFISADRTAPPKDSVVMRCICDRPQYVYEMPMFDDVTFEMTRHLWQSPIVDRVRFTCVNPQKSRAFWTTCCSVCLRRRVSNNDRSRRRGGIKSGTRHLLLWWVVVMMIRGMWSIARFC